MKLAQHVGRVVYGQETPRLVRRLNRMPRMHESDTGRPVSDPELAGGGLVMSPLDIDRRLVRSLFAGPIGRA
jgi:hypothetical protein